MKIRAEIDLYVVHNEKTFHISPRKEYNGPTHPFLVEAMLGYLRRRQPIQIEIEDRELSTLPPHIQDMLLQYTQIGNVTIIDTNKKNEQNEVDAYKQATVDGKSEPQEVNENNTQLEQNTEETLSSEATENQKTKRKKKNNTQ